MLVNPNDDASVVKSMIADTLGAAIITGQEIEVLYAGNVDDAGYDYDIDWTSYVGGTCTRWNGS